MFIQVALFQIAFTSNPNQQGIASDPTQPTYLPAFPTTIPSTTLSAGVIQLAIFKL